MLSAIYFQTLKKNLNNTHIFNLVRLNKTHITITNVSFSKTSRQNWKPFVYQKTKPKSISLVLKNQNKLLEIIMLKTHLMNCLELIAIEKDPSSWERKEYNLSKIEMGYTFQMIIYKVDQEL